MPIRMVDDPQDPNDFKDNNGGNRPGGGGGGGLFNLLPLLFMLLRKPGGLLLLVLLGGAYFFLNQQGCGGNFLQQAASAFTTGGMLSKQEFAKAPVYEGLSDDDVRNPLPEYVSLVKFAPDRQNQGRQGSCVAWSSA